MHKGNVPQCRTHTRPDQREMGAYIRIGECNRACHIVRELEDVRIFPLDAFNAKLASYSNFDLANADATKAAKHYGIKREHAAGYIRMEQERRGVRPNVPNGGIRSVGKSGKRKRGKVAA